jgi:bifunctional DNA-binding transcriptional regulator/antitoxin component of YhaV-PrlF toxin-antitoxin module
MRLQIEADGTVRLPEALLERWGISPGRRLEARVERGKLVLTALAIEGDPFAEGLKRPDEKGFEKAMRKEAEEKAAARDAFERLLEEKHDIDMDAEREERERWE